MSQPEKGSWCSPTGQSTTWPVASGIHSWKPPSAEANWRQCLGNSMVSTFFQRKKLESRETWRISLWMFVIFWWFLHMFFRSWSLILMTFFGQIGEGTSKLKGIIHWGVDDGYHGWSLGSRQSALNPPNRPWKTLAQPGLNDLGCLGDYPLVMTNIAIENGHL